MREGKEKSVLKGGGEGVVIERHRAGGKMSTEDQKTGESYCDKDERKVFDRRKDENSRYQRK